MANKKNVRVGDTVRINHKYATHADRLNKVGSEFVVTDIFRGSSPWVQERGFDDSFYVKGDPDNRGIWAHYIDAVIPAEPKSGTTTLISTRLSYENLERIVKVTNGKGALSLSVTPNPHRVGDINGYTSLTPEQAEELAHDLLTRVSEIRGGKN